MRANELNPAQHRIRAWVLISWTLLLMLVGWRQLQPALSWSQLAWAMFFSVPLWISLPGLWRGQRYTHQWATLCVLPYFIVGITEGVANAVARTWALWLLGASLLWFFALLAFVRVSPKPGVSA